MAAIFVSYHAEMQYGWHSFVATSDNALVWFTNSIYANNNQSKQIS